VIITSNPTRSIRSAAADACAALVEKPLLCDALSRQIRLLIESDMARATRSAVAE
jgi:hypothetical protein